MSRLTVEYVLLAVLMVSTWALSWRMGGWAGRYDAIHGGYVGLGLTLLVGCSGSIVTILVASYA